MQRIYRKTTTPALAGASRVIGFERGILTVGADNSAIAAKLRQLAPHILHQLNRGDTQVTGILVKVQVGQPAPTTSHAARTLGETARGQLADLAASLGESPLKCALLRLIGR